MSFGAGAGAGYSNGRLAGAAADPGSLTAGTSLLPRGVPPHNRPPMSVRPGGAGSAAPSLPGSGLGASRTNSPAPSRALPPPSPQQTSAGLLRVPTCRPFIRCRTDRHYEKLTKVGQGTFGEVHKARNKETGELVAMKKVLMKSEQEGFPLTALREIKIMKLLHHENVLGVKDIVHTVATDFNRQKGSIYMVFEYMEYDLGGLLNRSVEFTVPEVKCLVKQLLNGMHYIHTNKILHRDMKVANLLLNDRGILKIADFGLARGITKDSRYTSTVCTRWYRPPEILLGDRNYTSAIDMWGVGCVTAELFIGRPILQGGRPDAKDESENDLDQYLEISKLCGLCGPDNYEDFDKLPCGRFAMPKEKYVRCVQKRFKKMYRIDCQFGIDFADCLLTLDPKKRPDAHRMLDHAFLWEDPLPCLPSGIRKLGRDSHEFTCPPQSAAVTAHREAQQARHQSQLAGAGVGGGRPSYQQYPPLQGGAGSRANHGGHYPRQHNPSNPNNNQKEQQHHRPGGSRPQYHQHQHQGPRPPYASPAPSLLGQPPPHHGGLNSAALWPPAAGRGYPGDKRSMPDPSDPMKRVRQDF
jgi:serine/threonine protein kinase